MIIDIHTHIFPSHIRENRQDFFTREPDFAALYREPASKMIGAEELIRNMDRQGVDKSVVFGFPWQHSENFRSHNDYILEAVERFKGRLVGFVSLAPLAKGAAREIERCLDAGCAGIGEIAYYTTSLDQISCANFKTIADIALHYRVPIMLHANETIGHCYPGKSTTTIKELYDFLSCFPKNRFILAHWGGGIFFYHLMKKQVKKILHNTWFDTAASPYLYDNDIYPVAIKILGAQRILFGSDFPLIKPDRYFKEMKEAGLSKATMKKICGQNAADLLHL